MADNKNNKAATLVPAVGSEKMTAEAQALTLLRTSPTGITSGDVVSGVVRVDLSIAEKLSLVNISVVLRGKVKTVTGHGDLTRIQTVSVLRVPQVLWEFGTPLQTDASGIVELPWSIQMPSGDLPPSFSVGKRLFGHGKVQIYASPRGVVNYYVHLKATRKGTLASAIRIKSPLLFVPSPIFTSPPALQGWAGPWTSLRLTKKVRRGIFGDSGSVELEFCVPDIEPLPVYHPVPYRLTITSTSKPLPNDVSQFDFPRNPVQSDIGLVLRQRCRLAARHIKGTAVNRSASLGGLGPSASGQGDEERTEISPLDFDVSEAQWEPVEGDGSLGRWREKVTFAGTFTLNCQPPFEFQTISYTAHLDLKTQIPGIGNNMEVSMGPLRLRAVSPSTIFQDALPNFPVPSSGGETCQTFADAVPPTFESLDLPPSYWDAMNIDADEKDD